jgi:hypothetical protein
MVARPTRLGRVLFGYRPSHVRQFLLERDRLINETEKQIYTVRTREEEARAEIASLRQALATKEGECRALTEAANAVPHEPIVDLSLEYIREEIHRMMAAAEEGTGRILQRAQEAIDRQLAEQCRKEDEIAAKMEDLASRQESAGMFKGLARQTRILVREVPDRLREALGPLEGIVVTLDEKLDRFLQPPEVPTRVADSASPNGAMKPEVVVHIPDEGESRGYGPISPVPPVPIDDPAPRVTS